MWPSIRKARQAGPNTMISIPGGPLNRPAAEQELTYQAAEEILQSLSGVSGPVDPDSLSTTALLPRRGFA